MKKKILLPVLFLCLVLILTGCNKKKIETLESQLATSEASLSAMTADNADKDAALKALTEEKEAQLAEADE